MPNYASWTAPTEYDFRYSDDGRDVRLRPIGPEDLIETGALKYLDTMTSFVNEEHVAPAQDRRRVPSDRAPKKLTAAQKAAKDQKESEDFIKKMSDNPEEFQKLLFVIDAVLCVGVAIPRLSTAYTVDSEVDGFQKIAMEDRNAAAIYTDFIPFGERMVIFGELTKGLKATKSVPEERDGDMGALEAGEGLVDPA